MKNFLTLCAIMLLTYYSGIAQQLHTVASPDGKIKATIGLKDKITYHINHESDQVVAPSALSLKLTNGEHLGVNPKLKNVKKNNVNQTVDAPSYKRSKIKDNYNELVMNFKGDYSVAFRAYNDGVAYRFITSKKKDFEVENEEATFNFNSDYTAYVPYVNKAENSSIEEQFWNSFENTYTHTDLSKLNPRKLAFLPLVVEVANGKK